MDDEHVHWQGPCAFDFEWPKLPATKSEVSIGIQSRGCLSCFLVRRRRGKLSNRGRVRFMFVGLSRFHALACRSAQVFQGLQW